MACKAFLGTMILAVWLVSKVEARAQFYTSKKHRHRPRQLPTTSSSLPATTSSSLQTAFHPNSSALHGIVMPSKHRNPKGRSKPTRWRQQHLPGSSKKTNNRASNAGMLASDAFWGPHIEHDFRHWESTGITQVQQGGLLLGHPLASSLVQIVGG